MLLSVSGRSFCVVVIDGEYERVVSVPTVGISCGIARLDDIFWNCEKLTTIMNPKLAATIACAISHTDEIFNKYYFD